MDSFCDKVVAECTRARQFHPPTHSFHEGYGVLMEEMREFEQEVFKKRPDLTAMADELVQIAAVCRNIYRELIETATL